MMILSSKKNDFSLSFQGIIILLSKKNNFSSLFLRIMILLSKKNDNKKNYPKKIIK